MSVLGHTWGFAFQSEAAVSHKAHIPIQNVILDANVVCLAISSFFNVTFTLARPSWCPLVARLGCVSFKSKFVWLTCFAGVDGSARMRFVKQKLSEKIFRRRLYQLNDWSCTDFSGLCKVQHRE